MFPHEDPIDVGELLGLNEELIVTATELIELLKDQISQRRRQRIDEVIAQRTCTVVPVMEGLHDLGNVAAVLRSAEGLGYQVAHLIDTQPEHKTSRRITQGADKWVDLFRWRDTGRCLKALKEQGYRIIATDLDAERELWQVDFTVPTALVFGNEMEGVSQKVLDEAHGRSMIPVQGFVQSFNISVAAALSLYEAQRQRIQRLGSHGDLSPTQRQILRAHYYLRGTNRPKRLVPRLWKRR